MVFLLKVLNWKILPISTLQTVCCLLQHYLLSYAEESVVNRPDIVGDSTFWENTTMKRQTYTPEIKERAVRMLIEAAGDYPSMWSAIQAIAPKIGCTPETLRSWHKKHIDQTIPASVQAQSDKERIKELERECRELKQANEIIRKAAAFFAQAELGRPPK